MGPTGEDGVMVAQYRDKWWTFSDEEQRNLRIMTYLAMRHQANMALISRWVGVQLLEGDESQDLYEQALGINGWKTAAIPQRACGNETVIEGECLECGRYYGDELKFGYCPSDDCPSREEK